MEHIASKCIKMLSITFVALIIIAYTEVKALPLCESPEDMTKNYTIQSFVDDNNYIRMNISWIQLPDNANIMDISVENIEPCEKPFYYDITDLSTHVSEIIVPPMELRRPADSIAHCSYNITFKDVDTIRNCEHFQTKTYIIPECVEHVCRCQSTSPVEVSVAPIADNLYEVKWNTVNTFGNNTYNATLHLKDVYYKKQNSTSYTQSEAEADTNVVSLLGLQKGEVYDVITRYSLGDCLYSSFTELSVPNQKFKILGNVYMVAFVAVFLCFCIYLLSMTSARVLRKLRKYFPFLPIQVPDEEKADVNYVLFSSTQRMRQENNVLYTPLDFLSKVHDHFELPRNKIILGKIIGEGAFGKVFVAKAYDLKGMKGGITVAVKQLKDNAPDEGVRDFEAEIKLLKQIEDKGGHKHVVKLLACVTTEQPFMMVMELLQYDLKDYLRKLRAEWQIRRKVSQHFFPHDMKEDWLQNETFLKQDTQNDVILKYTTCMFENDTSSASYIIPENFPYVANKTVSKGSGFISLSIDDYDNKHTKRLSRSPSTPASVTSSQLPATPDTIITNLETPKPTENEFGVYPKPALDHNELQEFALQIAKGMAFLEEIPIVHRDLAARNILMTSDKQLKISDFGMSRTGPYVNNKQRHQPLRWMAIEAIENRNCDTKSDVWSFGVLLWEIGTLGGFPYKHTPNELVLQKLKEGDRLKRPEICTDELYDVMSQCWSEDPSKRPSFQQLVETLDVAKRKVYVDFDKIDPNYAFPPVEEATNANACEDKT